MKPTRLALIVLASFVVLASCSDESSPSGSGDPAEDVDVDVARGNGAVDLPTAPPSRIVETGDGLTDAFYDVLSRIVTEGDGVEKRDDMMAVVRKAFLAEAEAETEELDMRTEIAITDTVADVLDDMRDFRGIASGSTLNDQQHTMVVQLAKQYTQSARARAKDGIAKVHQGVLLAAPSIDNVAVPDGYLPVKWATLGGFTYEEGMTLPDEVMALHGKKVALTGYMMSIGEFENIHEFLLVESGWSCCFGQAPDVNQVLLASIPDDEMGLDNIVAPIILTGVLDIGEEKEDGWVVSVYRIRCDDVQEID